MNRGYAGTLVMLAALCLLATPSFGQDVEWTYMAGYEPGHSGVSPDELALPLALNWRHTPEIDDPVSAVGSAVVGPDMVYFAAGERVYGVDRTTGALAWELNVGASVYSTPLLHNGTLYFGADNNNVYAADARTGSRKWQFATAGKVRSAPLYLSGVLYFASEDGRIYALLADDHTLLWQFQTQGAVRGTPCYGRDTVYAASEDGHLYAVESRTGQQVWRAQLGEEYAFASPVMERQKVIVAAGSKLMAFDGRRGVRRWTFTAGDLISGTPAVAERKVYAGSHDGVVYCIDSNDGRILWRYPTAGVGKPVKGPLNIAGGTVFARSGDTVIMGLSLTDGSLLWEYKLPEPSTKKKETTGPGVATGGGDDILMGPDAGHGPGGGPPGAGPGDAGMAPGGGPGGAGDGGQQTPKVEKKFEESVLAGLSLSLGSAYIVASDGVLYGFENNAADNVAPDISGAVLDVPGRGNINVRFGLVVDDGDAFAGRYADLVEVPGAPPISMSVCVTDSGAGIDPSKLRLELDGEQVETTYDSSQGLLWYIYNPRGAARSLPNGVRNFVITAVDWLGNEGTAQAAFTVDNSLEPPGPQAPPTGPGGEMPGGPEGPGGPGGPPPGGPGGPGGPPPW